MTEARAKALEFLSLAQRYVEDADASGAVQLTKGALEWLNLWKRESDEAFNVMGKRARFRHPPER